MAMHVPEEYAVGTLRLSVGRHTTREDVEKGARLIVAAARKQRDEIEALPEAKVVHSHIRSFARLDSRARAISRGTDVVYRYGRGVPVQTWCTGTPGVHTESETSVVRVY